jgi:hypothetical protein
LRIGATSSRGLVAVAARQLVLQQQQPRRQPAVRLIPPDWHVSHCAVLHLDQALALDRGAQVRHRLRECLLRADRPRLEDVRADIEECRADIDAQGNGHSRPGRERNGPFDARWQWATAHEHRAQAMLH